MSLNQVLCVQDPGERPDSGGGRDQPGGRHAELRRLSLKEHLRNRQVRDYLTIYSLGFRAKMAAVGD